VALLLRQIVPTHVGVNRIGNGCGGGGKHRPHARGGEPFTEQFRSGTLFAGYGIYGNGTYAAYGSEGFATANIFARMGRTGRILRLSLRPETRTIAYEELDKKCKRMQEEIQRRMHELQRQTHQTSGEGLASAERQMEQLKRLNKAIDDRGVYAALLGYDAIDVQDQQYLVILNRTAVRVQKEDLMPRARS